MNRKRVIATLCLLALHAFGQADKSIEDQIRGLRAVPDSRRGSETRSIAARIRALPGDARKVKLAAGLANLSTEGDFGKETLEAVAGTLAQALRESPAAPRDGEVRGEYVTLAQLARYEGVRVEIDDPSMAAAMRKLEAADKTRQSADFKLTDLEGREWTLSGLRGKVVLVNFWATWCPPCRKEIPDLNRLYRRFKDKGLVILGISDEESAKVLPFAKEQKMAYPVLLDPGRKAHTLFQIESIPKNLVYDREGKLVAQSVDMRTERQFLEMLAKAGLR
jgi:peroxiredoxin